MMKTVEKWTSSGKTFKVGDVVVYKHNPIRGGVITSIEVCDVGDGHVILDGNPDSLTDFCFMEFDKSHYRDIKLEELGI